MRGTVQGVGFRPFVYRLARGLGLGGWVLNDVSGVSIEVTGLPETLERFRRALHDEAPPAAHVEAVSVLDRRPGGAFLGFEILESRDAQEITTVISPDLPVCEDCLREMRDVRNRRYRYPFINCTNCGPRFSIIEALPYDRPKTTMKAFGLCAACEAEYHDPRDRRFHAQPVACAKCGPGLALLDPDGTELARGDDAIVRAASALRAGEILAIKGLGGYHLACDARNEAAVQAMRARKFRKEKAFALMAGDLSALEGIVELSDAARNLLGSSARPIVLMPKVPSALPESLAPDNAYLGAMLPYTPLQHLLFDAAAPALLVMTSANRSSEPIAYRDDEALERLHGLADGFVVGEREIARRLDDSVAAIVAGAPQVLRRARGYAPAPVLRSRRLKRPILAVGVDLKSCVALGVNGYAFVGQHLGDLENLDALDSFRESIRDLCRMYRVNLEDGVIVHDLHPNFASTQHALTLPGSHVAVQHHRAHIASVLAERADENTEGWDAPVLGFAFDGTGLGDDGTIWGGEIFHGSLEAGLDRVGQLRGARLPGGDAAARHPVQAAVGFLSFLGDGALERALEPPFNFPTERVRVASASLRADLNVSVSSSMGRLFDTVAALTGFTRAVSFEGQAAIWLESLASRAPMTQPYPFPFDGCTWDHAPLLERVLEDAARGVDAGLIARGFHEAVAQGILEATLILNDARTFQAVALSGGVFQNRLLTELTVRRLEDRGYAIWLNRQVPPNDGGISLGQIALAVTTKEV